LSKSDNIIELSRNLEFRQSKHSKTGSVIFTLTCLTYVTVF